MPSTSAMFSKDSEYRIQSPETTPQAPRTRIIKLADDDDGHDDNNANLKFTDAEYFQSIAWFLTKAMLYTRPDIAYAVQQILRGNVQTDGSASSSNKANIPPFSRNAREADGVWYRQ